jgi:hypothetical protein
MNILTQGDRMRSSRALSIWRNHYHLMSCFFQSLLQSANAGCCDAIIIY